MDQRARQAAIEQIRQQQILLRAKEKAVESMTTEELLEEAIRRSQKQYENDIQAVIGFLKYGQKPKFVSESKEMFKELQETIEKTFLVPKRKTQKPNDYLVEQLVKSAQKQQQMTLQLSYSVRLTTYLIEVIQRLQYQSAADVSLCNFYKTFVNNYSNLLSEIKKPKAKFRSAAFSIIFSKRLSKQAKRTRSSLSSIALQSINNRILYGNLYRSYSNCYQQSFSITNIKSLLKSKPQAKPELLLTKLLNRDLSLPHLQIHYSSPVRNRSLLSNYLATHYDQMYQKLRKIEEMVGNREIEYKKEANMLKELIESKDQQVMHSFKVIRLLKNKICDILEI